MRIPASMARLVTLAVLITTLGGVLAFPVLGAADQDQFTTAGVLEHIQEKAQALTSLTASFHQRKLSRLLADPVDSAGRLYWQPPYRLRWDVVGRTPFSLIAQGEKMLLLYPDLRLARLYRHPLGGNLLKEIIGTGGEPKTFKRRYRIRTAPVRGPSSKELVRLTMEPRSTRRSRHLKRLEVIIDSQTWLPQEIHIFESDEDSTVITLSNLKENPGLSDGLFSVAPPAGFKVESIQGEGRP